MATRVLIIHRQLVFAVTIKQALEQTGLYDVHPFTTADAAFTFLRDHPQDVAVVDYLLPGRSGARIVQQLRAIQPDLAVIISPYQPRADVEELNIQGMLDVPFSARDLIQLLRALDPANADQPISTRRFDPEPGPSAGQVSTRPLPEEDLPPRRPFGTTNLLNKAGAAAEDNRAQTRDLSREEQPPAGRKLSADPSRSRADTQKFDDELRRSRADTDRLKDNQPSKPGQTKRFAEEWPSAMPESPASTRQPGTPPAAPAQTRDLDDQRRPPPISEFGKTRDLDAPDAPPPAAPAQTRSLEDDRPYVPPKQSAQTRQLDRDAPPFPPGFGPADTQKLDDPAPTPKSTSGRLNEILKSFEIEPPFQEGDTPNVPIQDSDAVRQFLATARSLDEAEAFDDVLGAIDPEDAERPRSRRHADFEGLVQSMRSDEPHHNLPNRQQQMMDFILSTGMESVLQEIEKTKTGSLVAPPSMLPEEKKPKAKTPSRLIDRLAQEEPPMPTLEESGTVSDLLTGINESEFRSVLSMLSGNETDPDEPPPPPAATTREKPPGEPRSRSTEPATGRQQLSEEQEDPAQIRPVKQSSKKSRPKTPPKPPQKKQAVPDFFFHDDEPDEGATVAQVVLSAALDDKRPPDTGPALDKLISDIENRLAEHKLNIRPLPSWNMDTTAFRAVSENARLAEPSFLPEELPPGEMIPPTLPEFDDEPQSYAVQAEQQTLESFAQDDEGTFDNSYLEDTTPSKPTRDAPIINEPARDDSDSALERAWAEFFAGVDAQQAAQDSWQAPDPDVDDLIEEQPDEASLYQDELFEPEAEVEPAAAPDDLDWPSTPAQPDFAPETLPEMPDEDYAERYADQQPDFIEAMLREQHSAPAQDAWHDAEPAASADDAWALPSVEASQQSRPPAVSADDWSLSPTAPEPAAPLSEEEALVAQLALNLTQVSLELSAEATLLSKFGEIIAFAGHLSQEDMLELRQLVQDDWEAVADGARVRFITLPSSGKEYMLYSIRAQDDLTLSMIFAGATPLRIIRKQAQRLIDALQSVPEPPAPAPETALVVEAQPVTLTSYGFLWLLHESRETLSEAIIQALRVGLTTQLREQGWVIDSLDARDDYIYLLANIPGEKPSHQIIRDLKRRSAEIAHAQNPDITPQTLWADGYFILTPGRALTEDEIAEFIHFQRMG